MAKRKLTDIERGQIRDLRAKGLSNSILAKQYGVSVSTIVRICRPELYKKNLESNKEYRKENGQQIYRTRKANSKTYKLEFHKINDAEVIAQLEKQGKGNMHDYIRSLIYQDIQRKR